MLLINFSSIILRLPFLLFSFLDIPGPVALPEYTFMSKPSLNHVSAFQCS